MKKLYFLYAFKAISTLIIILYIMYIMYNINNLLFNELELVMNIQDTEIVNNSNIPDENPVVIPNPSENALVENRKYLAWTCYNWHYNKPLDYGTFESRYDTLFSFREKAKNLLFSYPNYYENFKRDYYVSGTGWYSVNDRIYLNSIGLTIENNQIVWL